MDEIHYRLYTAGDQNEFKRIFDEHSEKALRLARVVVKDDAAAADAVQEAFIRAYLYRQKYRPGIPFAAWFSRIVVNECRRILSSGKRSGQMAEILRNEAIIYHGVQDTYENLYAAIESLPEILRAAILLKYIHGFSEKEISFTLGIKTNTVKSRLYQARQKLKEILDIQGGNL